MTRTPTLTMTRGLPASGKSTWALEVVRRQPHTTKRVNKDELRAMLDGGRHSRANERFVLEVRDAVVAAALAQGLNVIVDDTNFAAVHEARLRQLAAEHGAEFEVRVFDVPVEECIRRDLARPRSVGERVIRGMHRQYLAAPPADPPAYDPDLPAAIIVDVDGTLALMNGRGRYDERRCGEDLLNGPVAALVRTLAAADPKLRVLLCSGRHEAVRDPTEAWMHGHDVPFHALFMRADGDNRNDAILKRELYDANIRGRYNVRVVLDDRDRVVNMWRLLGLTCLQVTEGDF